MSVKYFTYAIKNGLYAHYYPKNAYRFYKHTSYTDVYEKVTWVKGSLVEDMIKYIKKNSFAILSLIIVFGIQLLAYSGTRLINSQMKTFDLSISFIDNNIPFVNWFIIFYIACYPWWYLGPLLILKYRREGFYEYLISATIGYIIGGIIFIVLPTEIERPIIDNNNILNILVNFIYSTI